jgi:two-component system, OmpR family, phosphate regulon sensor histidine kinase PhoR
MRLGIAAKSVLPIAALVAFSLSLVGVYVDRQERAALVEQTLSRLEAETSLISREVAAARLEGDAWARRTGDRARARVTVIAADGRVLADSDEASARMENHADRPEVMAALRTGSGHAVRFSHTLSRDLVYYAQTIPMPDADRLVLRLAVPMLEVASTFGRFRRDFLVGAAVALVLAAGIAYLWAYRITRPLRRMVEFAQGLSRGEMGHRLSVRRRDELGGLADALNRMAADLRGMLERLEDEGRRIRTIMDSMAEGVLVIDGRGHISLLNPAAETMLGLRRDWALGQTPLEAVRSVEFDDLVKAAAHADGPERAEIVLAYPRRRMLAGTAVGLRDESGAVTGTVLALRDITELKRLEDMRMEFVLNVSHELRTPLTAIRGYAETLLESDLGTSREARRFVEIIHRHADRMGRLLSDLLDLSNIELERAPLHLRPAPLADATRQAVASLAPQAERKGIRLDVVMAEDLPPVLADRDRLAQILVNLIDNAVKYTPEGGKVTVRGEVVPGAGGMGPGGRGSEAERTPDPRPPTPGPMVKVVIEDTGIGIPEKDLPRITERFYRVDKARSRELGGTGLGLAIVKHLVQAHNGSLRIESALGRGTTVHVMLPSAETATGPRS